MASQGFRARAQGSTEYLILLAVVLIVALVSIALLGFFPGISEDQKIAQNKVFWKGQSPLAILDAVAGDEGLWTQGYEGADAIKITLQNKGGEPLQIIAIFGARGYDNSAARPYSMLNYFSGSPDTIFGSGELSNYPNAYQYFSPGFQDGAYNAYLSQPYGSGTKCCGSSAYTQALIIPPGGIATVGFTFPAGNEGTMTYPVRSCTSWDGYEKHPRKSAEFKYFNIYYAEIYEENKILRQAKGTLIASCSDDIGDSPS